MALLLTVSTDAVISGYGLAVSNENAVGGVTVVNNGTISVDAGNTPTAGGSDAALFLSSNGGLISYTGGAIANNGTGTGLEARQGGVGSIAITLTGDVTAVTGPGINAVSAALGTGITINAVNVASSMDYGVYATNNGSGATEVNVTGLVQGSEGGIGAINGTLASDLTVRAGSVVVSPTGPGFAGIVALNDGNGATRIDVEGPVSASGPASGIITVTGEGTTSLTVDVGSVSAEGRYGMFAANGGTGATLIEATGDVSGGEAGIYAVNGLVDPTTVLSGFPDFDPFTSTGTDLTIAAVNVVGGDIGIFAANTGNGITSIRSTGLVEGGQAGVYGIQVFDGDLVMSLTDVTATESSSIGVYATNAGFGSISVTANGTIRAGFVGLAVQGGGVVDVSVADVIVSSDDSIGILVASLGAGTDTTTVTSTGLIQAGTIGILAQTAAGDIVVNANNITLTGSASDAGIDVVNFGTGSTTVTSSGLIQAGTTGIHVDSVAGDVVVNANNITLTDPAALAGIDVENFGTGSSTVTTTGVIDAGVGEVGIGVHNDFTATSVTVNAASASGSLYGIVVFNDGTGPTSITTSGTVVGGEIGIYVDTFSGAPTTIINNGTVANRDMLPSSLAVHTIGGTVDFTNNGNLIGTVELGDEGSTLTNAGIWYVPGGTSEFGAGANLLVNEAGGTIIAGTTDGVTATTLFDNVGTFTNRGTFTMAGGAAGDRATLNGNASFTAGSVYAVDLGAGGAADLLTVNGTVALLAGSTVTPDLQGGLIDGERYTVLTATGGVTGEFGSVDAPATAFLSVEDFYDANNVYLDVTQYRSFASAGLTPNQIATATGLQSLPTSNALFNAILNLPTDAQARAAFDSLSGEIGASAKGVLLNDSQFLRSAVFDRLTSAGSSTPAGGIAVAPLNYAAPAKSNVPYPVKAEPALVAVPESAFWAQGFGSWGDTNGNSNAAGLDRDTGGFFIGADTLVGDWRLGVLGGYSQTSFDVDARASSGESDNFHIGAYAGTNWGAVNFRAGASYTWNDISTSRSVFIPTAQLLEADYDAGTAQVFGELGYGLTFGAVDFEPFVGLAYVNLNTDGYTETGGIAALSSGSDSTDATYSTLGLRVATTFALGSLEATAKGMLGWRHAFGDITPTSAYQFASGSSPFTVGGVPIAEDAALVEVGLDLQLLPLATFGVAYGGQFGDGATDQSFTANLSMKF